MNAISIKTLVASATAANLSAYHSKFGPKSLDTKISADSETTLQDLLAELTYENDPEEAALGEAERRDDENRYRHASLLPSELDRLLIDDAVAAIASDVTAIRIRAELGEGWKSTLDVRL